jgi:hypothetical protein
LPDDLLEVRLPGEAESTLVLVAIETYPDADVQVLDDVMLITTHHRIPRRTSRISSRGRTPDGPRRPAVSTHCAGSLS